MSKIKVTFVETNCKKNGPIKQTLNIIRNMDKEAFEPSLVTVWPEDADNSMIDEYKKLGMQRFFHAIYYMFPCQDRKSFDILKCLQSY